MHHNAPNVVWLIRRQTYNGHGYYNIPIQIYYAGSPESIDDVPNITA